MTNVVYADFTKSNTVSIDHYLEDYLEYLRYIGVDEDDVCDVADAINDVEVYLDSDEVVKHFADNYFQSFM